MPSPGQRASAELAANPARSDRLIADAAACTPRTVQRQRRALERRGVIAPVPSGQRQHAWAAWPSRNPGAYARAAAELAADPHRSNRAIAAAARCTHPTVLRALRARAAQEASAAIALDALFTRTRLTSSPRPCCPITPAGGLAFPVGWPRETPAALRLCARYCPVRAECETWSLTLPDDDPRVYAGLTHAQRLARKQLRPG